MNAEDSARLPTARKEQLRHLVENYRNSSDFNYSIHISEDFGFIFFNNPKAGCTTTKATLNLECARRLGTNLKYASMADIHSRTFNVLKSPAQVGLGRFLGMVENPQIFRFCILREPVSRFAAAFASKLAGNTPHRRNLNALVGRARDAKWQPEEFAELVRSNRAARDLDEHWRLQFKQVSANRVAHTEVGFQEKLDASLHSLLRRIFRDEASEIFDARRHFPRNSSGTRRIFESLSQPVCKGIREAYAEDVAFYKREWNRMHDADTPPPPS